MADLTPAEQAVIIQHLPKVDLHRHLEGSLRLDTLLDTARTYGLTIPLKPRLNGLVQVQPDDPLTFISFLSKFQTLRLFYLSPKVISRIVQEAIEDAAADGVVYLELHFTPVALSRTKSFRLADVMDWVCVSAWQASQATGITVRLIPSFNRHEDTALAAEVVDLAIEHQDQGVVGVDLAGNEAEYSAEPFRQVLNKARHNGLHLTIHAGEWSGPENVRHAIEDLGAERIGHGVRILEDERVVELARKKGTTFEVCITSNYQTGVVPSISAHPLRRMIEAGLKVTLNTDDPSISNITLGQEYLLACSQLGLSLDELRQTILTAGAASFQKDSSKQALLKELEQKLA